MPWEPSTQTLTLLIERHDLGNGRYRYHLCPFFRRREVDGSVYLAPLSEAMSENSQLEFARIEYVERPQMPNASQDGDTVLTGYDYYRRQSVQSLP
jgi:hypothetical protein